MHTTLKAMISSVELKTNLINKTMTIDEINTIRLALDTPEHNRHYVKHTTDAKMILNKEQEAINYSQCCKQLKDKEENNIEIKTLGDLKRAYPEGKLHTVNGYGKIINYSVDGEIVYTRHL